MQNSVVGEEIPPASITKIECIQWIVFLFVYALSSAALLVDLTWQRKAIIDREMDRMEKIAVIFELKISQTFDLVSDVLTQFSDSYNENILVGKAPGFMGGAITEEPAYFMVIDETGQPAYGDIPKDAITSETKAMLAGIYQKTVDDRKGIKLSDPFMFGKGGLSIAMSIALVAEAGNPPKVLVAAISMKSMWQVMDVLSRHPSLFSALALPNQKIITPSQGAWRNIHEAGDMDGITREALHRMRTDRLNGMSLNDHIPQLVVHQQILVRADHAQRFSEPLYFDFYLGRRTDDVLDIWKSDLTTKSMLLLACGILSIGFLRYIRRMRIRGDAEAAYRLETERKLSDLNSRLVENNLYLTKAKQEAEVINETKSRVISATGHDLWHPISASKIFLEQLAGSKNLDESDQKAVRNIANCLDDSGAILRTLRDATRSQKGIIMMKPAQLNSADLFEWIDRQYADIFIKKGLRLKMHCPLHAVKIRTDETILKGVLRNLIENSIKYTTSGGVLIGLRRRNKGFLIQVWDTGVGISDKDKPFVFTEHFQANNQERDHQKGVGLGLYIVKHQVDLIGGKLTFRSKLGRGSVFELELLDRPKGVCSRSNCPARI